MSDTNEQQTPSPSETKETTRQGWWSIKMDMFDGDNTEISDCTLEHIAKLIIDGCTSGEIIEHSEEDEVTA